MKRYVFVLLTLVTITNLSNAQGVGIGTSTPDASAILEIKSGTKGILLPRTSTTSRNSIANPAKGLILYDSTTSGFWFNSGSTWVQLSTGNNSWSLMGNSTTNPAINFIGTTDDQPLRFRVNNTWAGEINPTNLNVFFGSDAGNLSITGQANSAFGDHALFALTDGNFNSANGYLALTANTTGYNNTAHGAYSLYNNTFGYSNTAIGRNALFANTTGSLNTAVGTDALLANTGSYNSATGYQAAYSNTSGSFNTANGCLSLYANTGGSYNTANGYQALNNNITGLYNTASGLAALYFNKDGLYNTADGNNALYNNNGSYNTASGNKALYNNSAGHDNTGIGNNALSENFDGNFNTAIGSSALLANQYGYNNTAIGYLALASNGNGYNNTAVGYAADISGVVINATAIGSGAVANASNKVRIGNSSVTVIEGQVAYSFPSDARFKYNIKSNVPGLDFIEKLTPVTYYFDDEKLDAYSKTGIINNKISASFNTNKKQAHTGFLAQDVEKIAKEVGYEFDGVHPPANDKDHYSLAYSQFIMPLVKAVQEQQVIIEDLKKEISEMKAEIRQLKK